MSGELIRDQGLILRNFNAKESDNVIHCLTQTHGKLHLYAKHARNSKRRFSGGLDPLTLGSLEWKVGRSTRSGHAGHDSSGMVFLESFRTIDGAHRYLNPFSLYQAASLWVECVDSLCAEGHIQPGLYEIAKETLAKFTVLEAKVDFEREIAASVEKALILGGFHAEGETAMSLKEALIQVEDLAHKPLKAKW